MMNKLQFVDVLSARVKNMFVYVCITLLLIVFNKMKYFFIPSTVVSDQLQPCRNITEHYVQRFAD